MYATLSVGLSIFLTFFVIIVTCGLMYLLIRSVIKERKKYKEENQSLFEGCISKNEIQSEINYHIQKIGAESFFGLLLVEITEFEEIKKTFGEEDGGTILEVISKNMLKALPYRSLVSRIKENQFLIFDKTSVDRSSVIEVADKILELFKEEVTFREDIRLEIKSSLGIAFYPMHGNTYSNLLNSLDLALYVARRKGYNKYAVYSKEIQESEKDNLEYYHQIKEAIKNNEFCLYYQPIIDTKENKIYGFEGLLRWIHPTHGVLNPFKFINIMEQTGDINWVGLWGLEEVFKEYLELKKNFPFDNYKMHLNLSPKQLINPNLVSDFKRILKQYKLDAGNFCLEIDEFAIFEKYGNIKEVLKSLQGLGFKIAIDGFGLDYSTLSKLEYTPTDFIKLDREMFGSDEEEVLKEKYINFLIDFVVNNNKVVISEGIEDENMLNKARLHGIDLMQGYYFSKPISKEETVEFIKNYLEK